MITRWPIYEITTCPNPAILGSPFEVSRSDTCRFPSRAGVVEMYRLYPEHGSPMEGAAYIDLVQHGKTRVAEVRFKVSHLRHPVANRLGRPDIAAELGKRYQRYLLRHDQRWAEQWKWPGEVAFQLEVYNAGEIRLDMLCRQNLTYGELIDDFEFLRNIIVREDRKLGPDARDGDGRQSQPVQRQAGGEDGFTA